jgi:hypothetical protein
LPLCQEWAQTLLHVSEQPVEFYSPPNWDSPATRTASVTLGQTTIIPAAFTLSPNLGITSAGGFAASGDSGGPFTPSDATYTLSNVGGSNMNWSVSKSAS